MIIKYWNKFRFWLIRKIAGDSVSVIINMKIEGVTKYLKPVAFSAHSFYTGRIFIFHEGVYKEHTVIEGKLVEKRKLIQVGENE